MIDFQYGSGSRRFHITRVSPLLPLPCPLIAVVVVLLSLGSRPACSETLHNGIELPSEWPPQLKLLPDSLPTPPYLASPPAVIPIDVGRQLFVDDFLIEETTLERRFHRPVYHPANPVITADREWEQSRGAPMAMPYSGGVWFDPADGKFKAWYMGGYNQHLCLAESLDGVSWTKPDHGVVPGTNIVLPGGATESNTLWMDLYETDPARRFKFFTHRGGAVGQMVYRASPDGIRGWTEELWKSGRCGDRTTVLFNPFRERWVVNVRDSNPPGHRGRSKRYWEVQDINDPDAVAWPEHESVPLWVTADRGLDAPNPRLGIAPQLYHLDAIAYESVMLGVFSIFRGYSHDDSGEGRLIEPGRPKHNDVCVGFSRDGFHWTRPDHEPFLPRSDRKGDWNWGNIQSVNGGLIVAGDYLYIYCSGRAGGARGEGHKLRTDADGSTGLAVLRRDGFASLGAEGADAGTLVTRPIRFSGSHLFVNADASAGELRVEVLDAQGVPIGPFTRDNCVPIRANGTLQQVSWQGAEDLASVAGEPVRLRFSLRNGSLYSFWVSEEESGASGGFVGAGGPGFTSHRDTTGRAAYAAHPGPLADAGADQSVRAADGGAAEVTLHAGRSTAAEGAIANYEWLCNGEPVASGRAATIELPVGQHALTLRATDDRGRVGHAGARVTVLPKDDPVPPRRQMVLWLKANDIGGLADGAPVQTWPDAAGNVLDPFQDDPAKRPVWHAEAVNGQPAVRFDGIDDKLRTRYYRDLLSTSYNASAYVVFRAEGEVGERGLVSSNWTALTTTGEAGGGLGYTTAYPPPTGKTVWTNVKPATPASVGADRWVIGAFVRSGSGPGQTRLFVDGVRNDDAAAIPYHSMNAEHGFIGCRRNEEGPWKGDIAEVLIYADALTDAEHEAVQRYLSGKYGLSTGQASVQAATAPAPGAAGSAIARSVAAEHAK